MQRPLRQFFALWLLQIEFSKGIRQTQRKGKLEPSSSSTQQSSQEQIPILERIWRDQSTTALSIMTSQKITTLLEHNQNVLREKDGAVEFERLKKYIGANFPHSVRWSNNSWINNLARGGGGKKIFLFCMIRTGTVILYFRAIQGHSGETIVDPTLLDNVLIPKDFFQFIYHVEVISTCIPSLLLDYCRRKSSLTRSTGGILHSR